MLDFLLFLLLGAILLFFFSSRVRQWVLIKFLQSLQRRLQKNMQERYRQQQGQSQSRQQSRSSSGSSHQQEYSGGKVDIDDIAIKKFSKPQQEDYVDFEEIRK